MLFYIQSQKHIQTTPFSPVGYISALAEEVVKKKVSYWQKNHSGMAGSFSSKKLAQMDMIE